MVDTPYGFGAIQRNLDRLEKWLDGNLMKFNNRECKVLHLGRNNCRHSYMLEDNCLESFAEEDLGVLIEWAHKQCALMAKDATSIPGAA